MLSPYQNFIICDFETGGLPSKTKKAVYDVAVTEIALVAINSKLEIVEQASWLVKPYKEGLEYNPAAAAASGITKQMTEEQGEDIFFVQKEIVKFLKKYKQGSSLPVMGGHNFIKFDSEFMLNLFEFCKDDLLKYVNNDPEDTIKWSRLMWPESTNYKLGTCCENAGITLTNAHRALSDTVATAELFIYFMKNLRGINSSTSKTEEVKFRHTFEI